MTCTGNSDFERCSVALKSPGWLQLATLNAAIGAVLNCRKTRSSSAVGAFVDVEAVLLGKTAAAGMEAMDADDAGAWVVDDGVSREHPEATTSKAHVTHQPTLHHRFAV